jgi:hypothetical protein
MKTKLPSVKVCFTFKAFMLFATLGPDILSWGPPRQYGLFEGGCGALCAFKQHLWKCPRLPHPLQFAPRAQHVWFLWFRAHLLQMLSIAPCGVDVVCQ